ncbi:nucleoside monophosphate kinase [Tenacibaculum mesophilum]|uniref:nucleoside monophosphate kinase n=1 Tax=Tenacibaculum mesophilum TaxID=104268 RepID=UPI00064A6CDE|nr:nucleoside monophosphate kinase [Tenacibaculum mesophilum]
MKKIQIIYALNVYGTKTFSETLANYSNSETIYLSEQFNLAYKTEKTNLILKIKEFINNGEIIPAKLINEFVTTTINKSDNDQILIGYPMMVEQYEFFINSLSELNIELTSSWIIDYEDIELIVKKELEIKGDVHCKKVDWTFDDELKIMTERLSNFKKNKKEIAVKYNQQFKKIIISKNDNHTDFYLEQIKVHNKV